MKCSFWTLSLLLISLGQPSICHGEEPWVGGKWLSGEAQPDEQFGAAVDLEGSNAIVGTSFGVSGEVGSAYIFKKSPAGTSWQQVAQLMPANAPVPEGVEFFGRSVAISGDTAVVTAFSAPVFVSNGLLYIFRRDHGGLGQWGQVYWRSFPEADLRVSLDADRLAVSVVPISDVILPPPNPAIGVVHVLERDLGGTENWGEVAQVTHDGSLQEVFGLSVSLADNVLVVGSPSRSFDPLPILRGAAYVFERDNGSGDWDQVAKFGATSGASHDEFGIAVAAEDDRILVGEPTHDGRGGLYVFGRAEATGDWQPEAVLTASDVQTGDRFAETVAIDGQRLIAGAPGGGSGGVYRFEPEGAGWIEAGSWNPTIGAPGDRVGAALAASGSSVLAGNPMDDDGGADAGAVWLLRSQQPLEIPTLSMGNLALLAILLAGGGCALSIRGRTRTASR